MYETTLIVLYTMILIPAMYFLIRFREVPLIRRLAAGLGIMEILVASTAAEMLCNLLS